MEIIFFLFFMKSKKYCLLAEWLTLREALCFMGQNILEGKRIIVLYILQLNLIMILILTRHYNVTKSKNKKSSSFLNNSFNQFKKPF
jgi:hypothetical protein